MLRNASPHVTMTRLLMTSNALQIAVWRHVFLDSATGSVRCRCRTLDWTLMHSPHRCWSAPCNKSSNELAPWRILPYNGSIDATRMQHNQLNEILCSVLNSAGSTSYAARDALSLWPQWQKTGRSGIDTVEKRALSRLGRHLSQHTHTICTGILPIDWPDSCWSTAIYNRSTRILTLFQSPPWHPGV